MSIATDGLLVWGNEVVAIAICARSAIKLCIAS